MAEMVKVAQWMVLPYSKIQGRPGLYMSVRLMWPHRRSSKLASPTILPPLNTKTLLSRAPMEAMQFGPALERCICHIVHADSRFEHMKMIKVDLAEGVYRV
jgi:hypothetical protein